MKKLYARLVLWLIRPAVEAWSDEQEAQGLAAHQASNAAFVEMTSSLRRGVKEFLRK
jgi:hypothetical protein